MSCLAVFLLAAALTPEDILTIREPSDLRLAPDGARVAYVVTEAADPVLPRESRRARTIWLAATDGRSEPRTIAGASKNDASPRWSPDGKSLAFLSDREGSMQIYLQGGETTRFTNAAGGVEQFAWSPDGSTIAFVVRDALAEADPIVVDRAVAYARLWVVNVSDKTAVQVTRDDVDILELAWSLDGRELALTTTRTPGSENLRYSLVVVDRASGKIARTLTDDVAFDGALRWSPDGRLLTFYHAPTSPFASWIAVVPAAGGAVRPILKDYRGTVLRVEWLPGGSRFMVQAIEGTRHALLSVDAMTGEREEIAQILASQWETSLSTNGTTIVYLAQRPESPADVWAMERGRAPRQLTDLNPQTRTWSLGAVSDITWKNAKDGLLRRGVVITPPGYQAGKRYPTVVMAHPGDTAWWPGWQGKWWAWGQLLATNGFVVFHPNYRGVTGEGAAMHDTIGDWGVALQDLEDGVDALVARGIADPDRLGIGGWSNGGYMTAWTISQTRRYKAAVAISAHIDFFSLYGTSYLRASLRTSFGDPYTNRAKYDARSPITFARNIRTPTLILHGINDPGVPVGQAYELHTALKANGTPVEMVVYPRERHSIGEYGHRVDVQRRALAWFDRYLRAPM